MNHLLAMTFALLTVVMIPKSQHEPSMVKNRDGSYHLKNPKRYNVVFDVNCGPDFDLAHPQVDAGTAYDTQFTTPTGENLECWSQGWERAK